MNEDDENLSEEGLFDPYESELKKEKDAEKKRIEEAKDDLTEGKIRRKRTEETDEEEGLPLASRLFDQIDAGLHWTANYIADAAEDKEGWTDDVVRGTLGTLQWIGNLPVLKQIGQLEEGIVGGVRNLAERQDLIDPRLFTYSTRIGIGLLADKGVGKVLKAGKVAAKTRKINQLVRGKNILGQPLKPITPTVTQELLDSVYGPGGLKGVLLQQLDNVTTPSPSSLTPNIGTQGFLHSVYPKRTRGLYKQLDKQGVLDQAEEIIKNLDAFKNTEGKIQQYAKWNPNRPTTGFKGTRTVKYTNSSGVPSEVAFRWSVTENTYVPYDLVRRQNTILKRMRWNVNRSPTAKKYADKVYKKAKSDNKLFIKLLKELRQNDPQKYFDIMGDTRKYATNKGFIYVEHIHPQNSPWWKYMTKDKFKPRDTKNLMIAKEEFGKLKTSIENEIYNNKNYEFPDGKRLLLDYDKTESKFILKQLQDNGRLKWVGDISAITNPRDWRKALDAALRGHVIEPGKLGEIQQVIQADTDIPKLVDAIDDITGYKDPRYDR